MSQQWQIQSLVVDIFTPPDNPVHQFILTVNNIMNSNTVLIKGQADKSITIDDRWLQGNIAFIYDCLKYSFQDLFLDFDKYIGHYDYYDWEETTESLGDFYAGYTPWLKQIIKLDISIKAKPVSYLGFIERLYWMLRLSPVYHFPIQQHIDEASANRVIQDVCAMLFGAEWRLENLNQQSVGLPHWVNHPWTFYDITPDFLNSTGYFGWSDEDEVSDDAYFDGGASDSCMFFFKDKTFYFLLTNGAP